MTASIAPAHDTKMRRKHLGTGRKICASAVGLGTCALIAAAMLLGTARLASAAGSPITMEALVQGKRVEGRPLAWSNQKIFLLARNGELVEFAPGQAKQYQKVSDRFSPYSQLDMRGMLQREFGPKFDVTATGHFLVVHPAGQKQQWASRFEDMYRSFLMYFRIRGVSLKEPEFPLVAIVFANAEDFRRYAAADGTTSMTNMLGYYSPMTNRVVMYDVGDGKANGAQTKQNYSTILHEASHQSAFNTGIHSRWSPPPRWVAEGLGTMFEAPGVGNSRAFPTQSDRINRGRLRDFKALRKSRKPAAFAELLTSDAPFSRNPTAAYAEAWALTFYLVETMPRDYARYLAKTASRPAFTAYQSSQRLKDFTDVFGSNLKLLDAKFLRFMDSLN